MDFFRFDVDGKIIEHWDTIQKGQMRQGMAVPCIESATGNVLHRSTSPLRELVACEIRR